MHTLESKSPRVGACLTRTDVEHLAPDIFIPLVRIRLICAVGHIVDDLEFVVVTHYVPTVLTAGMLLKFSLQLSGIEVFSDRFLIHVARLERDLSESEYLHGCGVVNMDLLIFIPLLGEGN